MSNAKAANAARALALQSVAPAALAEGISRAECAARVKAAYSKRTHDAVRTEYMAGRIAASLRASGDNRPDAALIAYAKLVLTRANAKGTGKLKKGQSRRTIEEENAYNAAKVAFSAILKAAGVKTVEKRGGARSNTGNGTKAGQGKAKAPKAANDVSPAKAAPKVKTRDEVNAYVVRQSAVLDAFQRKNAALMSASLADACAAFYRAVREAVAD